MSTTETTAKVVTLDPAKRAKAVERIREDLAEYAADLTVADKLRDLADDAQRELNCDEDRIRKFLAVLGLDPGNGIFWYRDAAGLLDREPVPGEEPAP